VPNGGGTPTNLTASYTVTAGIRSVAIPSSSATDVFFADVGNVTRICSVPLGGGNVTVVGDVADSAWDIAATTKNVYTHGPGGLSMLPVGGGSATQLATGDGN